MERPNPTGDLSTRVYRDTTEPINEKEKFLAPDAKVTITKTVKRPRRDKSDLGENFIAPDGGWAWLVCIAAGISNLSVYPCLQQFGFIFRERMTVLGMSTSEITTIINTNPAISACTGLLNGPMFRRFTFRQVGLAGSFFIFTGLILTAFCESFISYMLSYALLFGFGMGISVSASSLATNTYFKNKRRRAAGFSWTITGLGPIFLPYLVTFLLSVYGVQGTVFLFAGISLHTIVCALIYQPVRNFAPVVPIDLTVANVAASPQEQQQQEQLTKHHMCKYCEIQQRKDTSIFSSQYLYQDDDEDNPGYEIMEPGTPMMTRANDGWFGSKPSLTSARSRFVTVCSSKDLEGTGRLNKMISQDELHVHTDEFLKPNNFNRERELSAKCGLRNHGERTTAANGQPLQCSCDEDRALLQLHVPAQSQSPCTKSDDILLQRKTTNDNNDNDDADNDVKLPANELQLSFIQKVVTFFDLRLLRDFTYVNLVAGLTIINFGELNFSILTPFILNDFGFSISQITLSMSILATVDISSRFFVPFCVEKIPWDNRIFFLIGVVGIALGRTVVACTRSFPVILSCFIWIGVWKGVRTIFWPLIIPSYVPLKRLPAASGLQLLISGLFTLAAGPFVGLIRDRYDYAVTLHCLNAMSFIAAIAWTLEAVVRKVKRLQAKKLEVS